MVNTFTEDKLPVHITLIWQGHFQEMEPYL